MDFVDGLINAFRATGDASIERARLGKGDAARTLWVDANSEVPGAGLVYTHQDDGDADTLASRPTEYSTALNPSGIAVYGAPVLTAESKDTNQRIVLSFDPDKITDFMASSGQRGAGVGDHPHGIFDEIPIWLDSRQILNLSIQPKNDFGLVVQMVGGPNRTIYLDDSGLPVVIAGNIDIDLTASVAPTLGLARWVAISINLATGAPITTEGAEFTPIIGPFPVIPDILSGNLPSPSSGLGLGYVYLANAQTAIEHQHIRGIERTASGGVGIDPETNYAAINIVKGLPSFVNGSGIPIDWWNAAGAATPTEVKAQNEGIPRKYDRMIKVVVSAGDPSLDYLWQQYAPLYEELLDPSLTAVSLGVFVYVVGAGVVTVGLRDTVGGALAEADTSTVGVWEYVTLPNVTIGANDLELRFVGDTANMVFYVANPMLNVGPQALSWRPRGIRFVEAMELLSTFAPPNTNFITINVTAQTHPLAVSLNAMVELSATAPVVDFEVKRLGIVQAFNANAIKMARAFAGQTAIASNAMILMDGAQNLEVRITALPGSWDFYCRGFWRWE